MATPVYGKQYIRFAETAQVPADASAPIEQFRVVALDDSPANAGLEPPAIKYADSADEAFGVVQQTIPVVDPDKATTLARLATVATSGLLLIESDNSAPFANGAALEVDAAGRAKEGTGNAVTVNGTTPIVRQTVTIGGVNMVLVSFS